MVRPGSHVVHPDWSKRNSKVSTNAMRVNCIVSTFGEPVFDRDTGETTAPKTELYNGIGRVFPHARPSNPPDMAGQNVQGKMFAVSIEPVSTYFPIGAFIEFRQLPNIPLEDETLLVNPFYLFQVLRSAWIWERQLICTEDQTMITGGS